MADAAPPVVLFLCTANACRSQMAEALARHHFGSKIAAFSAGVRPCARVDPLAVQVLAELGIDASAAYNKDIAAAEALFTPLLTPGDENKVALVVTVCDNAAADCPFYARARRQVHRGFRDPPVLARDAASNADPLPFYRDVRDEIAVFIKEEVPKLLPALAVPHPSPPCQAPACNRARVAATGAAPISFFEKYLSLWVLLCMITGALIGYYAPPVAEGLGKAQVAQINAIVAVLLWIMIFPMLVQIDFASILAVRKNPGAIGLTSIVNYLIKPFSMYAFALLFFRVVFRGAIPDSSLRDDYIAGLILLAGAPCTAMVFVWSSLVGGDGAYTLVQVAFNDLLMLALYVPTCALLIGVSGMALPWGTIILAVVLFIVLPLVLASTVRTIVMRTKGESFLKDEVVKPMKPLTIIALLATLILIFIFQGQKIGSKPLDILMIAVPIILQTIFNFCVTYGIGYCVCIEHQRLAPAAMIATSNFFELAVAVAISVYGLDSGAALATVVGVLVEVPVMLALCRLLNGLKRNLDERCKKCDEVCCQCSKAFAGAKWVHAARPPVLPVSGAPAA